MTPGVRRPYRDLVASDDGEGQLLDLFARARRAGATYAGLALPVEGDYNGNGVVDAADYVVWRKSMGNAVATAGMGGAAGDDRLGRARVEPRRLRTKGCRDEEQGSHRYSKNHGRILTFRPTAPHDRVAA